MIKNQTKQLMQNLMIKFIKSQWVVLQNPSHRTDTTWNPSDILQMAAVTVLCPKVISEVQENKKSHSNVLLSIRTLMECDLYQMSTRKNTGCKFYSTAVQAIIHQEMKIRSEEYIFYYFNNLLYQQNKNLLHKKTLVFADHTLSFSPGMNWCTAESTSVPTKWFVSWKQLIFFYCISQTGFTAPTLWLTG